MNICPVAILNVALLVRLLLVVVLANRFTTPLLIIAVLMRFADDCAPPAEMLKVPLLVNSGEAFKLTFEPFAEIKETVPLLISELKQERVPDPDVGCSVMLTLLGMPDAEVFSVEVVVPAKRKFPVPVPIEGPNVRVPLPLLNST